MGGYEARFRHEFDEGEGVRGEIGISGDGQSDRRSDLIPSQLGWFQLSRYLPC